MSNQNKPLRNRFQELENSLQYKKQEVSNLSAQREAKKLPEEHLLHKFGSIEHLNWSKKFLTYSLNQQGKLFYQLENKIINYLGRLDLTFEYRALNHTDEMLCSIEKFNLILQKKLQPEFNEFKVSHVIFEYYSGQLFIELQCEGEQQVHYSNYLLLKDSLLNNHENEFKIHINEQVNNTQILISLNNKSNS